MSLVEIRAGDRAAFEGLVAATWDDLVEHLVWILGSEEAAKDAAQEALIRIWEHRERWHEGSARALVFRIGRNVAFDARRREQVRRRYRATQDGVVPGGGESPEEAARYSEYVDRFRDALDTLTPGRREVVELVRLRGLSHREAAEALELSQQTVANRMTLAMADLRTMLADVLPGVRADEAAPRRQETNDG